MVQILIVFLTIPSARITMYSGPPCAPLTFDGRPHHVLLPRLSSSTPHAKGLRFGLSTSVPQHALRSCAIGEARTSPMMGPSCGHSPSTLETMIAIDIWALRRAQFLIGEVPIVILAFDESSASNGVRHGRLPSPPCSLMRGDDCGGIIPCWRGWP